MPETPDNTHAAPLEDQTVADRAVGARRVDVQVAHPDAPGGTPQVEKTFEMGPARAHPLVEPADAGDGTTASPGSKPVFPAPADQPPPGPGATWDGYQWKASPHIHTPAPSEDSQTQRDRNVGGELSHLSFAQRLARIEAHLFGRGQPVPEPGPFNEDPEPGLFGEREPD